MWEKNLTFRRVYYHTFIMDLLFFIYYYLYFLSKRELSWNSFPEVFTRTKYNFEIGILAYWKRHLYVLRLCLKQQPIRLFRYTKRSADRISNKQTGSYEQRMLACIWIITECGCWADKCKYKFPSLFLCDHLWGWILNILFSSLSHDS